jgi:hypothetical protein
MISYLHRTLCPGWNAFEQPVRRRDSQVQRPGYLGHGQISLFPQAPHPLGVLRAVLGASPTFPAARFTWHEIKP